MSGQRRANWRTEMDAVIDAHRSEVARQFDDEAEIRSQHISVLCDRIDTLKRDRTLCVWAIAALILAVGLLAVTR